MNKGFLFTTSRRKIKSHVAESQITLFVWPCLSLTKKQRTVNHFIIFNLLSGNPTKLSRKLKKFVGKLPTQIV